MEFTIEEARNFLEMAEIFFTSRKELEELKTDSYWTKEDIEDEEDQIQMINLEVVSCDLKECVGLKGELYTNKAVFLIDAGLIDYSNFHLLHHYEHEECIGIIQNDGKCILWTHDSTFNITIQYMEN